MATYPNSNIRNVKKVDRQRINDDWEYLEEPALSHNPSTDELFNKTYKSSGLQATTSSNIRNPKKINSEAGNDATTNTYKAKSSYGQTYNDFDSYDDDYGPKAKDKKVKIPGGRTSPILRLKANIEASRIIFWVGQKYIMLQLPFAILSIIGLGASLYLSGDFSNSGNSTSTGLVDSAVSAVVGATDIVVRGVANFFGAGYLTFALFAIPHMFVLSLGIFVLMTVYIQFTMKSIKPLSGDHASAKIGTFLLAILGFAIPILNLFPIILFWIFTVRKYPK